MKSDAYLRGMKHYTIMFGEPSQRGMTRADLEARKEAVAAAAKNLADIKTSCVFCRHLKVTTCTLFDEEPPQKWQQEPNACESWEFDGVPF